MEEKKLDSTDAEFNMGLALLKRINEIMYQYSATMLEGRLIDSFEILQLMSDEMEFSLKDDEIKFVRDQEKELNQLFLNTGVNIDETYSKRLPNGIVSSFFKHFSKRIPIKNGLRLYNKLLRKLMNDKGMLMKQKGEDRMF